MNRARMHASAATYAISLDPTESALLSMLLEHEKEILALRKELEKKEHGEEQDGGRSESGQ
jgi:DNA-binding response OmpR family regulator